MDVASASLIRRQVMEMARRLRREADADEESWSRLLLLGAIDRYGEDATPGTLAAAEGLRSSNLAKALKELEAAGLITRRPDRDDRRRVRVALTGEGQRALDAVRGRRDRWLAAAIGTTLTEQERATLVAAADLLSRLARAP
ncbi:MarR family transcriptional regulator [Rhizosaccharibacter radicis]|uniref:MarR family transcriptional regulator n=1 Tax=Rhizosaccharibacter radicis TaxID=2782605 RepID=A0ABT1VYW3_9PROT|nr:MarR family transcriptional regulator [Acetobacteraceae bacterium KSS12]